jgi:hypothetical protein
LTWSFLVVYGEEKRSRVPSTHDFFQSPTTPSLFSSYICCSTVFSNRLNPFPSVSVMYLVWRPYKTAQFCNSVHLALCHRVKLIFSKPWQRKVYGSKTGRCAVEEKEEKKKYKKNKKYKQKKKKKKKYKKKKKKKKYKKKYKKNKKKKEEEEEKEGRRIFIRLCF